MGEDKDTRTWEQASMVRGASETMGGDRNGDKRSGRRINNSPPLSLFPLLFQSSSLSFASLTSPDFFFLLSSILYFFF